MLYPKNEENIKEKIAEAEKQELLEYCKQRGFTEEETKVFVENSLKALEETSAL